MPGVSRGNRPVRGTRAEPDRNGDDLPFCDFLGGWRVKKAPYEIRGLCFAACEDLKKAPVWDSWSIVLNRVLFTCYSRYLSRHGSNTATASMRVRSERTAVD